MDSTRLWVQMLGGFSIRRENRAVSDCGSRSHKVWLLLAYLIWTRGRTASEEALAALLWEGDSHSANPANALKTVLHRARTLLDQLGTGCGRSLILRREDGWTWNPDIPLTLDAEDFDRLAGAPEASAEALALYQGAFLPQLAGRCWRDPIAARLRERFLNAVLTALPSLHNQRRWPEMVELCRRGTEESPLSEALYLHWMTALLSMDRRQEAAAVYEALRSRSLSASGALPSAEAQALYRRAIRSQENGLLTLETVLEQIQEPSGSGGAYLCDYDFFKAICQAVLRDMVRTGEIAHLVLLSAIEGEKALPRHSRSRAMAHLREIIQGQLRRGDIIAACSASQFVILLPRADYENSRRVADRVIRAFVRKYPHAPVLLRQAVYPLRPPADAPGPLLA